MGFHLFASNSMERPFCFYKGITMYYNKQHKEARQIYKKIFGDIPKGFDIHHKDGNPYNNNPSNLESLSRKDHVNKHVALSQNRFWGMYAKSNRGISRIGRRKMIKQIESWLYQINNNVYW